jgi:hypothetical protein
MCAARAPTPPTIRRGSSALLVALLAPWLASASPPLSDLYRLPALRQLEISPSGEYLASIVRQRHSERVLVRRRDAVQSTTAFERASGIRRVAWIDDLHLVIMLGWPHQPTYHVVTLIAETGGLSTRVERIRVPGRFVSLLPNDGEEILWAARGGLGSSVYRLSVSALLQKLPAAPEEFLGQARVATLEGTVDRWVADREGEVRAALRIKRGGRSELWNRPAADGEWRKLVDAEDPEDMPHPVGIAEDGRNLIVASKRDRDTWALFELSAETGVLGRELLAVEGADITDVVYDYSGSVVIGAVYERDGLDEFHHFDAFFDRYQRSLAHAIPDAAVQMISVSRDRRHIVLVASGPRDPGTYYLLDTETNSATSAGRRMPWLDPRELVEVEAFRVIASNGTELEAFVARPESLADGPPPLVVLPHGGPAGIRDTRAFDPLVQYLAAGGLAVLQVNYRGSAGRGRTFLDAGKRAWGRGIEQDIEAAIEEVTRRGWVDGDRICVAGGSYGGYSALMSVIRRPDRYRCAACQPESRN